jgi:uncharacterized protein
MSRKIRIQAGGVVVEGELNDSETAGAIWDALPVSASVNTWGEEIYFSIPVTSNPTDTTIDLEVGDIAFWPPGSAFCIFFGATPASTSDKPVPASGVAIVGKIIGEVGPLKSVGDGEVVEVSRIEG